MFGHNFCCWPFVLLNVGVAVQDSMLLLASMLQLVDKQIIVKKLLIANKQLITCKQVNVTKQLIVDILNNSLLMNKSL